jgi:hypothetical protein
MPTSPQQRRALTTKQGSAVGPDNEPNNIATTTSTSNTGPVPSQQQQQLLLVLNSTNTKSVLREVKSLSLETEIDYNRAHSNINHKGSDKKNAVNHTDDDDDDDDETEPLADHPKNRGGGDDDGHREYLKAKRQRQLKLWKESPFAIGLTEPTWMEERDRHRYQYIDSRSDMMMMTDESGCLCMSAMVCPLLGASRVGNMAVLKSTQEWVEEMDVDDETNEPVMRRYTRPRLDIVVGPYWPMLFFVTYPLIFGVSGWAFLAVIVRPGTSIVVRFVWTVCTLALIISLGRTSFRDPGILYRQRIQKDPTWRWSEQADTYRPRHAWFDMDTAVVIEGFDHTYVHFRTKGQSFLLSILYRTQSIVFIYSLKNNIAVPGLARRSVERICSPFNFLYVWCSCV